MFILRAYSYTFQIIEQMLFIFHSEIKSRYQKRLEQKSPWFYFLSGN